MFKLYVSVFSIEPLRIFFFSRAICVKDYEYVNDIPGVEKYFLTVDPMFNVRIRQIL